MRKLNIIDERVKVTAHFHEEGSVLRGDKHGEIDGFDIEIIIETEEPDEEIEEMIALAHRMCFTEAAISQAVEVNTTHLVNGKELTLKN